MSENIEKPVLELKNISIGYSKKNPVLSGISYSFFNNKIYGLLGESGKGKTTLFKTICGLLKPIAGEILIDGSPIKNARVNDIYMMFQNYTCFDWMNCIDNVLIGQKIKHGITNDDIENAKDILQRVGLGNKLETYPTQLSGGQKQRLALARTIFMSHRIVLMDEPLSALDEITREDMQNLIIEDHSRDQNIIIMITHSKKEAEKMCDDIIYFK